MGQDVDLREGAKMDIRPIRNDAGHQAALHEIERLMNARPGSEDFDKLDILGHPR